jgi:hypothetical protein
MSMPIDFQGRVDLGPKMIEHLERYLHEKESRLAHQIFNLLKSGEREAHEPILPEVKFMKLSEGVEGFTKRLHLFSRSRSEIFDPEEGKNIIPEINKGLWEYTEVLEGCVTELFQQVKQVPIDRWHVSLFPVVNGLKEILIHRLEDLIWAIRRLEKPLNNFAGKFHLRTMSWMSWIFTRKSALDPHLLQNLVQTEKVLKASYANFDRLYDEFELLSVKVEQSLEIMKRYPVLASLELPDQNLYIDLFRLLKMLELNRQTNKELTVEGARALKFLTSIDHVLRLFRLYFRELQGAFFNGSLEWKSLSEEEGDFQEISQRLQGKVIELEEELKQFKQTMSRYRMFVLKNDPNPYVRSRWGFTEWIVGPEPEKAKKLLNLIYSTEELEALFIQFSHSLIRDPQSQEKLEHQPRMEIEKILHEMGQPLIPRSRMHHHAERLLEALRSCDEIGSPLKGTIHYVEAVLSKAMREDWKYHILHEFNSFHQIYRLHEGLKEFFEDPAHAFRIDRFRHLFAQIQGWVEKEEIFPHVKEIELDINDMKTYLQDFLASVQRYVKEKSEPSLFDERIKKYRHQLFEYRYLFGGFFSKMMAKNQDGQQLRNQFLFVDQYFETIERLFRSDSFEDI